MHAKVDRRFTTSDIRDPPGSLQEAFGPGKADALWDCFDFVYTQSRDPG